MENPWFQRTPWGATRRRMDALYERTFNVERMPDPVLSRIDDFFGPLNLETVSQVINFARDVQVSDRFGDRSHFDLERLSRWPRAGTLLVSAINSGMVNPNSSRRMEIALAEYNVPNVSRHEVSGGHQDCLMGASSRDLWVRMEDFL
jgi:hypothetical protein